MPAVEGLKRDAMRRRDVLGALIATGITKTLGEVTPDVPDSVMSRLAAPSDAPTDFGTLGVQDVLYEVFPHANLTENDDYFGLQTEALFLGFRKLAEFRVFLGNHRDYALQLEAAAVQSIRTGNAPNAAWLADAVRRRVADHGVFLSQVGLARTALIGEFGSRYQRCDTQALARENARRSTD